MPLDLENFTFLRRKEIAAFVGDDDRTISGIEDLQRLVTENLPELIEGAELSLESLDARVDVVEDALADGAVLVKDEGVGAGAETHTLDFVGAGVTAATVAGVTTVTIPGGAAGSWSLHDSRDYDVIADAAQADFTGLAGATDIMILVRNIILSVSGVTILRCSVDNGSTYYATSGDYVSVLETGVEANTTAAALAYTPGSTSARSGVMIVHAANVANAPKACESVVIAPTAATQRLRYFVASNANDVDAVRVMPGSGGNFTGGQIYCFKR